MKPSCVLDASIIARWWVVGDKPNLAAAARGFLAAHSAGEVAIHVPDLALAEVANVLWKAVRFGDWTPADLTTAVRDLREVGLRVHPTDGLLPAAVELALACHVTVCDALYAALARELGAPLYTADRRLAQAVEGVQLLEGL